MNTNTALLKHSPVFFSRLGFCYDPPMRDKNGKVICFTDDHRKYADMHDAFAAAGVRVHTGILHSGWVGVGEYDYSLTDTVLEELFRNSPDVYYIPRVKLNVPVDWCRQNPQDTFVYWEGVPYRDDAASLVGTLRQDWLGYNSPTGYYQSADSFHDDRPNVDSLIALQSFSSAKWLQDAGEALTRLIDHIEAKYGDRILGYHIAYGACGESMLWGRDSQHYGDYGVENLRCFYRWGLEKYGSHGALENAWGVHPLDADGVFLPSPQQRYFQQDTLLQLFRADNAIAADYDAFMSQTNADALLHFCRLVKQKTGKLTGGFYGYMNYMYNSSYAGHLAMDRVLHSPWLDFLAAPKSYYRCGVGDAGGFMCPVDSVNRHKLWLDELDNRTHLAPADTPPELHRAPDLAATEAVFWREFAKNLAHDSSFWWMDLGGGWFSSPEVMDIVRRMMAAKAVIERSAHSSCADVLVLTDEVGMAKMMPNERLNREQGLELHCELARSGVLYDNYRLCELPQLDTGRYKLVIFDRCYAADDDIRAAVEALRQRGVSLLFGYAAGIWNGDSCCLQNSAAFTGFALEELPPTGPKGYPGLRVRGCRESLCRQANSYICTAPGLSRDHLRAIAQQAGCHLVGEAGGVYYGDDRFLGVFSGRGQNTVRLPRRADWRDLVTGCVYPDTDAVTLSVGTNSAHLLVPVDGPM